MDCRDFKEAMMGYLDGELYKNEIQVFEEHLESCQACRAEFESYQRLFDATESLKLPEPADELWERYWDKVYNRLERKFGWALFGSGALVIGCILADMLLKAPGISWALKVGCAIFLSGFAVLFISVLREQLHAARSERYGGIKR